MSGRIAIVIDSLAGGGAERSMLTLAIELHKLGNSVHMLVLHSHNQYEVPDYLPVHYWQQRKSKSSPPLLGLDKMVYRFKHWIAQIELSEGKFDFFISNLDKSNLLMSRAGIEPTCYVVHNTIRGELDKIRRLGPFKYAAMLRAKKALNGKHIVTVSQGIAKEIATLGLIRPRSVTTIYNPFDIEDIRQQALQHCKQVPTHPYILHVGRFARQKRHDILFQALGRMAHPLPLVLLCNNINKARKCARKYGVEDKVIFPGFQSNPYPWMKNAALLVLSSDHEGLGNVLIESLICGTPVVSTNCPYGPNEILTDEMAEFLVPCQQPDILAKAMDKALQSSPVIDNPAILAKVSSTHSAHCYTDLYTWLKISSENRPMPNQLFNDRLTANR